MIRYNLKMVTVYFSAPSTSTPEDLIRYKQIVDSIKKAGGSLIQNWVEENNVQGARELFEETVNNIKKSQVLVAEITNPSTGVGQQIAMAISWKIPVLALKRKEEYASKFTLGTKSPYLTLLKYTPTDLTRKLAVWFDKISTNKFIKFNFITTREIYDYLENQSATTGESMSECLRRIAESWIEDHRNSL